MRAFDAFEQVGQLADDALEVLSRHRPAIERQQAGGRHRRRLVTTANRAEVERRRAENRVPPRREARLQLVLDQRDEHPRRRDRVDALLGRAAVRRAPLKMDLEPLEPLVTERDPVLRRLADHRAIGAEAGVDQLLGAEALHLLVDHGGERHPARRQVARQRDDRGRHRRDRALHVDRAAAEKPAVANLAREADARVVGVQRHRVGMPAEQQMAARASRPATLTSRFGRPGQDLLELHPEVALAEEPRRAPGPPAPPGARSRDGSGSDELGGELDRSRAARSRRRSLLQQVGARTWFPKV